MKQFRMIRLALLALGVTMSASVFAAATKAPATERGLYVDWRGGYGYVNSNPKTSAGVRKESVKRRGAAFGYDIGYMVFRRLGVEVGRAEFRNVRYQGGQETNLNANYIALKGFLVISNGLDIYLKAGEAKSYQNNPSGNLDAGDNSKDIPYGAIGIQGKLFGPTVWSVDATGLVRKKPVAAKYMVSAGIGLNVLELF